MEASANVALADDRLKWRTLGTVAVGALVVQVDTTIVNVALPPIQQDLGAATVTIADLQWVINAYTLAFAVLLLLSGRIADLFGRKRMFIAGVVLFVASSAACGAANDITVLIAARAVQGVGAALITPASLSLVSVAFPPQQRGMALGIWSGVVGLGIAIGPLLGGVLAQHASWRWVFLINLPIGLGAVIASIFWVRESRDPSAQRHLDPVGVLLSGGGLFLLTFGLLKANDFGWGDIRTIACLAVGVISLLIFIGFERREAAPVLDLTLFRSPTFSGANVAGFLVGFAFLGFLFYVSVFLQNVMRYSATTAGLAQMPLTGVMMLVAPATGKAVDRFGPRWILSAGMAILAVGLGFFARLDFTSNYAGDVLPGMMIAGLGFALVFTPLTTAALSGVPLMQAGVGSAVVNTMRQAGGSLGLAVLGAISAAKINSALLSGQTHAQGFVNGIEPVMLVAAAGLIVGAAVAALTLVRGAPAPAGAKLPDQLDVQKSFTSFNVAAPSLAGRLPDSRAAAVAAARSAAARLEVVEGPAHGSTIMVGSEPLVFGRASPGLGALGDDSELSRQHARISRADGQILVEDLGSTNGTFVNGRSIAAPTPVSPGDVIAVGTSRLRVLQPSAPPAVTAAPGPLVLTVVAGPASGSRLQVREAPVVLGRAERGAAKLAGDPELSRRHASVSLLTPGRLLVEDLGSRNGTFVNDHRIVAPTLIGPGDTMRVGTSVLKLEAATSAAEAG